MNQVPVLSFRTKTIKKREQGDREGERESRGERKRQRGKGRRKMCIDRRFVRVCQFLFSRSSFLTQYVEDLPMAPPTQMMYDITLNRSNSDCTTRKTDRTPFVRLSVERSSMRRKKVRMHWRKLTGVLFFSSIFLCLHILVFAWRTTTWLSIN